MWGKQAHGWHVAASEPNRQNRAFHAWRLNRYLCRDTDRRQGGRVPIFTEGDSVSKDRRWRGADRCSHREHLHGSRVAADRTAPLQDYTASLVKADKDQLALSLKTSYTAELLKFTGTFTQAGKACLASLGSAADCAWQRGSIRAAVNAATADLHPVCTEH